MIRKEILKRVEALKAGKGDSPVLIAIDGRCASGKTTLAEKLQEMLDCSVIHMDHFFLRPQQRTAQRYAEPGGNIDYERFLEDVVNPLKRGEAFSYRPFDCSRQQLSEPIPVKISPVVIIEGSYACHPALWDAYDLHVFLTVDKEEQLRRIRKRNGEDAAEVFREKWIPLEERYFAAYGIEGRCELIENKQENKNE